LRANKRTDVPSHVIEGLVAYAVEQSSAEQQRAIRWTTQWSAVRERAQTVLKMQLSNVEAQVPLPELVVVLDDDDDDDDERDDDDDEDDDDM
jgi:hypothetical protein